MTAAARQVLVAGVGNIFFRDDGFGPAVAAQLLRDADAPTPGVQIVDYGIRGMHLAYDLLDPVGALVLIDAIPGDEPGTVTLLEVDHPRPRNTGGLDAHGMQPVAVLAALDALGGTRPPTYVVGCVPEDVSEGIGLSPMVESAVPLAADRVRDLVRDLVMAGVR
jgi:hydrogenase maturation protease